MKTTKFLFACLLCSLVVFNSCKKEEENPEANLNSTYNLTKVTVDGVGTSGSGTITFTDADNTAKFDFKYRVDNVDYSLKGDKIIYTANATTIVLGPGTSNVITWTRLKDESKLQQVQFTQKHENKDRKVVLDFTK